MALPVRKSDDASETVGNYAWRDIRARRLDQRRPVVTDHPPAWNPSGCAEPT